MNFDTPDTLSTQSEPSEIDAVHDATAISTRFSQYIKDHGILQTKIAKRVQWSFFRTNRVFRGHQMATHEEWVRLADAAGVPPTTLGEWLYPNEFAQEAKDYIRTQDESGADDLRLRVENVLREPNPEVALFNAAADKVKWTVGAAAFVAHHAVMRSSGCLAVAIYFFGRVLQDRNLPDRAQWALETARLIAKARSGPSSYLLPYVDLSLANLAVERERIPEGIGLFEDVREQHEDGSRPLKEPRQLAHLYGFLPEAKVLRDIERKGALSGASETVLKVLDQHERDLTDAMNHTEKIDRPHWKRRFTATRGLVRIGRGNPTQGLQDIAGSVAAFWQTSRLPADVDAGAYCMALHALAYVLMKLPFSPEVKKDFAEAERFALRDRIFVVMRICRLVRKLAPFAFALFLLVELLAPGIAWAGNGCKPF